VSVGGGGGSFVRGGQDLHLNIAICGTQADGACVRACVHACARSPVPVCAHARVPARLCVSAICGTQVDSACVRSPAPVCAHSSLLACVCQPSVARRRTVRACARLFVFVLPTCPCLPVSASHAAVCLLQLLWGLLQWRAWPGRARTWTPRPTACRCMRACMQYVNCCSCCGAPEIDLTSLPRHCQLTPDK